MEQQVELHEVDIPEENPLQPEMEALRGQFDALGEAFVFKKSQLSRITAVVRT